MNKLKNLKIMFFVFIIGILLTAATSTAVTKRVGETATITVTCTDPNGNLASCSVTSPCSNTCSASGSSGSCSCEFTCASVGTYDACGEAVDTKGASDSKCLDQVVCTSICSGSISLALNPSTVNASDPVTPSASGLSDCDGWTVYFKKDSCLGTEVSSCSVSGSGCTGTAFISPSAAGSYAYYACVDKNVDGDYTDSGESDSDTLTVIAINGICESTETQDNAPEDCRSIVSISPTYTYAGQEVAVVVYFNDSRYKESDDVKIELTIDDQPWTSTNGCDVGGMNWTDMGWDGSKRWEGMHMGKGITIDSMDRYGKIQTSCTIPLDLSPGTHTLRATPTIYSPITLRAAELQITVLNGLYKLIMEFIQQVTGLFSLFE